jgi:steroid delta-isomerase-like uncharacterized protein
MSQEKNKKTIRDFFAAMDRRDLATCAELIAADAKVHFGGMPPMTREQYRQLGEMFLGGFSELTHTIDDQIAVDETVITRLTWKGRHTGPLMGIPATGKVAAAGAIRIDRFEHGRIKESRVESDMLGAFQQLGIVPSMS